MGVNSGIPSFTNIMAQFSWHAMVFSPILGLEKVMN